MAKPHLKLNSRQELFCKEYLVDKNATQAAIRAGYSKKTAYSQGQRLLKHVEVKKRLAELQAPMAKKLNLSAEMVLGEMKNLAFSNIDDFFDDDGYLKQWRDITRDQKACLAQVDMILFTPTEDKKERLHISQAGKLKFWDKVRSLNMLGNHFSLLSGDSLDGDEEPDEAYL